MKKVSSFVISLSMMASVVAPAIAGAQSMSFNTNLTVGSRGDAVVALQSFLVSKGLLTMPAGVAMGYFGQLTRSAVAAYQVSKGIQPSAGYFGPITRAAANADGSVVVTTTPGCSAGALFNSMTGAPCTVVSNPTTPVSTSGVEGSLIVNLAAAPANNSSIQTSNDVPVYGLEFKAKIADVVVQTVDLQVSVTLSGTAENPSTLINTVKVWDGSTVIATVPVNSTTFTKDSNQVYYLRLSGLNFLVPKEATKVLTISFSTNSIDSNRSVSIDGYNSSSVRAVSGNGISSFYSIDGSAYTRTHIFMRPGTSNLTLSAASSPLRSQNYRVNTTSQLEAPALLFNVKSDTGDSKIITVVASSSVSGEDAANLIYSLYDGSTLVSSKTGSTSVTFNNLSVSAQKDVTKTLTVKVTYPATSSSVTTPYINTTDVTSVTYEKPNGSSASVTTTVRGVGQYVYTAAPMITLASTPTIKITGTNTSGSSTALEATFVFNVTAQGGTMLQSTSSDFTVAFGTTTADAVTSGVTKSVVVIPNNNIADGATAQITVTAQLPSASVPQSGLYNAAVSSFAWNVNGISIAQTYGLTDFKTASAANFIK